MAVENPSFDNTGAVIDGEDGFSDEATEYHQPTEREKKLVAFVLEHTDQWRDWRDQNYGDAYDKYERIFRGIWNESDKQRQSERSKLISPATQQAIETRHAEFMEAVFGQGEFFDIKDDLADTNGSIDVEKLKNQLMEDFATDKIRKSFDQIALLAEIYGTGIGEIEVLEDKRYFPMQVPISPTENAYGTGEKPRVCVKLHPVNPKNFLFDPNGCTVDECLGVAVERVVGIHKISEGIESGKYLKVELSTMVADDELQPTQEDVQFSAHQVQQLTYYGMVPKHLLEDEEKAEEVLDEGELERYESMVEAIIVIANKGTLLKAAKNPYMMSDRPILTYQADTVPNRLLGRGAAEKADNMQSAIDASMRLHFDAMALVAAPMVGLDATRLPRGAKFEVKPGKALMFNGPPGDAMSPMKFGSESGQAMDTAKEFERMLLMATGTVDSAGQVSQVSRDGNMDMATATLIKKYKRTLVNFQEDFLVPFIYKASWRYMQFDPERYPARDVKFIPTATLGIISREYEQKRLAFLMQTLGAQSPLTPILMNGIIKNSGLPDREAMIEELKKMSQPNPQTQQAQIMGQQLEMQKLQAEVQKLQAEAQKTTVEAQIAPVEAKARVISAVSNNLSEDDEATDFERRMKMADLMLRQEDIQSNERIAKLQTTANIAKEQIKANQLQRPEAA